MKFNRRDYQERIIDLEGIIPEDEPVFLLRAKDVCAPGAVAAWAHHLEMIGGNGTMIQSAFQVYIDMKNWQKAHGSKTPDLPEAPK